MDWYNTGLLNVRYFVEIRYVQSGASNPGKLSTPFKPGDNDSQPENLQLQSNDAPQCIHYKLTVLNCEFVPLHDLLFGL